MKMNTGKRRTRGVATAGSTPAPTPAPISEEELEAASAAPLVDPELDEVEPAEIDDRTSEPEVSFAGLVQKGRRLPPERVRILVESLLFAADKPLSVEQLFDATGVDKRALRDALGKLVETHQEGASGIVLTEVAGGWQFRTESS